MTVAFTNALENFVTGIISRHWLSTMSAHSIVYEETYYHTAEHLFQCLRFPVGCGVDVIKTIRAYQNPAKARRYAMSLRHHFVVEPLSDFDVDNMRLALRLKVEQHPCLKEHLLATEHAAIVKDCSIRPSLRRLFWGAALICPGRDNEEWVGKNVLGNLWMELRASLR